MPDDTKPEVRSPDGEVSPDVVDLGPRGDGPSDEATDRAAGFEILPDFERFNQHNDMFSRSWWDPTIRSDKTDRFYRTYREPVNEFRAADGFGQKDYAIRNAAWHVSDLFAELKEDQDRREGFTDEFTIQRESSETKIPVDSPAEAAKEIKSVAKLFGAALVGITGFDRRWVYTHKYTRGRAEDRPNELPDGLTHAIVVATKMDRGLIDTVPSALSGAATGLGYSSDVGVVVSLAQYIRNMGYQAIASQNDTALTIPMAIKAGLGEYGRHGLLITKEFGPRVRLSKVFTDLPMTNDKPVDLGVRKFCDICRKCSQACPPKAITFSAPSEETHNRSNIVGIRKWTTDAEKCFGFWAAQNSDCSICIRVCPYNKDFSKLIHKIGIRLAGTPLRRLMLKLDDWLGHGARVSPKQWWARITR